MVIPYSGSKGAPVVVRILRAAGTVWTEYGNNDTLAAGSMAAVRVHGPAEVSRGCQGAHELSPLCCNVPEWFFFLVCYQRACQYGRVMGKGAAPCGCMKDCNASKRDRGGLV